MRAWRWHCTTHDLSLLTMQTGANPPMTCSGLAEIVYPDDGPCFFHGTPILHMFPGLGVPVSHDIPPPRPGAPLVVLAGGASGEAGRVATPPLPATRHTTT